MKKIDSVPDKTNTKGKSCPKSICPTRPVCNLHCNGPTHPDCVDTIALWSCSSVLTPESSEPWLGALTDAIHTVRERAGLKPWVFKNIPSEPPCKAGSLWSRGCHCRLLCEQRVPVSVSKGFHVLQSRAPIASLQQCDMHHCISLRISYFFAQ